MPTTHTSLYGVKETTKSNLGFWDSLYKVYARVEIDKLKNQAIIEVIDGYLKEGEELRADAIFALPQHNLKVLHVEIVSKMKKNTYLKTSSFDFITKDINQFLVCIIKNKQIIGYQYIDLENNLLGEPKFHPNELMS
ncbi:MAG: hypothetical protein MH472_12380 [Bacteroidia bacterium]|nr:hypothetical protein [Bacteroidia bacterium]